MQDQLFPSPRPTLEDWLKTARRYLIGRCEMYGRTTTDDIYQAIEYGLIPPFPEELEREPRHLAQVWDRTTFYSDGAVISRRHLRHHGLVTVWKKREMSEA